MVCRNLNVSLHCFRKPCCFATLYWTQGSFTPYSGLTQAIVASHHDLGRHNSQVIQWIHLSPIATYVYLALLHLGPQAQPRPCHTIQPIWSPHTGDNAANNAALSPAQTTYWRMAECSQEYSPKLARAFYPVKLAWIAL